jgi:hypothetical protein
LIAAGLGNEDIACCIRREALREIESAGYRDLEAREGYVLRKRRGADRNQQQG